VKEPVKLYKTKTIDNKDYILSYVIIDELPMLQIKPFEEWLFGQTVMKLNGKYVAFYHDYERWYDYWINSDDSIPYKRQVKLNNVNE